MRALVLLAALPMAQAMAQRPLPSGPVTAPTATGRLTAPRGVTVQQTAPGEITLTWNSVPGAKSYVIGRAVGSEGFRRMLDASTGAETVYVDRRSAAGVKHVYTITPISSADVSGIRATSGSIVPTAPSGGAGAPAAAAFIVAQAYGPDIVLRWQGTGGASVYWYRPFVDGIPEAPTRLTQSSVTIRGMPPGRHRFELVAASVLGGRQSVVATSAEVTIAATTTGGTATGTPATTTSGTTGFVPSAPPVTVRVGGTITASAQGQWSSLAPSIASVAADGTITGRAVGSTSVVALAVEPGGAMRVTVVRVDVLP
jgi:hypothetical protein